jgi:glucose-6-phosphate isomerase
MRPGKAVYVPGRYAHRSINLSDSETLVTFFVFRADAGHNYGTIEEQGFRKLVVASDEGYKVIDNPNWKSK